MQWFRNHVGDVHGVVEDTERTFLQVKTVKQLLQLDVVDWSTLGMILSSIVKNGQ